MHKINLLKRDIDNCLEGNTVKKPDVAVCEKITTYFKSPLDESIQAIVFFAKICTSYDIRRVLEFRGYMNVPKSPSTVSKMVFDYGEKIRKQLTEEIALCNI